MTNGSGRVALVVLMLAVAPPVRAAETSPDLPSNTEPWYLKLSAGWFDSPSLTDSRSDVDSISFTDGQLGSMTLGKPGSFYGFNRVEVEVLATKRNLDQITRSDGSTINGLGDWQSGHLLVNAYRDLPYEPAGLGRPYLGVGAGVTHLAADYNGESGPPRRTHDEDTVLTLQGVAGVRIPLRTGLMLDAAYRFRASQDFALRTIDGTSYTSEGMRDHQVDLGLAWTLTPDPSPDPATRPGGGESVHDYGELLLGGVHSPSLVEGRSSVRKVKFKPGPKLTVRWGSPWRGANPFGFSRWDLEAAHRVMEVESVRLTAGGTSPGRGHWRLTTLMANGHWDFPTPLGRPYLGVGLGAGWLSVDYDAEATPPQRTDDDDVRLTYQTMIGWQWALGPALDLVLGYRLTGTTTPELSGASGSYTTDYIEDHQLEVGTRYPF